MFSLEFNSFLRQKKGQSVVRCSSPLLTGLHSSHDLSISYSVDRRNMRMSKINRHVFGLHLLDERIHLTIIVSSANFMCRGQSIQAQQVTKVLDMQMS